MSIKIKFEGFENILRQIEDAGGTIDKAADSAMRQSAQIVNSALKSEMKSSGVPSELINAMPPPEVEKNGNSISVKAGYKKGTYDPENLSDGYKVVMLNYGTPHRTKHGQIHEGSKTKAGTLKLGFIQRAKKKAMPNVKKAQREALDKILARLKK